jgi:hypothetical protein
MGPGQLEEGAGEGGPVEPAFQAHCRMHVVGRAARHELVDEPEALLGEGEGEVEAAVGTRDDVGFVEGDPLLGQQQRQQLAVLGRDAGGLGQVFDAHVVVLSRR